MALSLFSDTQFCVKHFHLDQIYYFQNILLMVLLSTIQWSDNFPDDKYHWHHLLIRLQVLSREMMIRLVVLGCLGSTDRTEYHSWPLHLLHSYPPHLRHWSLSVVFTKHLSNHTSPLILHHYSFSLGCHELFSAFSLMVFLCLFCKPELSVLILPNIQKFFIWPCSFSSLFPLLETQFPLLAFFYCQIWNPTKIS